MDVDDDASVADGMDAADRPEHGRLDAVVACAGWGLAGAVEDTPIGDARDQFETLFWGCGAGGAARPADDARPRAAAGSSS